MWIDMVKVLWWLLIRLCRELGAGTWASLLCHVCGKYYQLITTLGNYFEDKKRTDRKGFMVHSFP